MSLPKSVAMFIKRVDKFISQCIVNRLVYPVRWLQTFAVLNIARFIEGQANST